MNTTKIKASYYRKVLILMFNKEALKQLIKTPRLLGRIFFVGKISNMRSNLELAYFDSLSKANKEKIIQSKAGGIQKKIDTRTKKVEPGNKRLHSKRTLSIFNTNKALLRNHFDSEYYSQQLENKNITKLDDLILHYIEEGYLQGLNPQLDFSSSYYLENYEDVATSGMNPFIHYLKYGIKEKRSPNKKNSSNIYTDEANLSIDQNWKIGVCIHITQLDVAEELIFSVNNITHEQTIVYISVSPSLLEEVSKITEKIHHASKIIVEEGYSSYIYQLALCAKEAIKDQVNLICNLHDNKLKGLPLDLRTTYKKVCIDPILGSENIVNKILSTFNQESNLSIIGSAQSFHLKKYNSKEENVSIESFLLNVFGENVDRRFQSGYFAESVFWTRLDTMKPLIDWITNCDFSNDIDDDRDWIQYEILFGILPTVSNQRIGLSYSEDISSNEFYIETTQEAKTQARRYSLDLTLTDELALKNNVKHLAQHLNITTYKNSLPFECDDSDSITHLLRYGLHLEDNFQLPFDHHKYLETYEDFYIRVTTPFKIESTSDVDKIKFPNKNNFYEAIKIIQQSNLFDANFYRKILPNLPKSLDPLTHFCIVGWKQYFNPSANFDSLWYANTYLRDSKNDYNPLLHYILIGKDLNFESKPPQPSLVKKKPVQVVVKKANRVCLFAAYDIDGIVDETVITYVKELSKYSDVFVLYDSIVSETELSKLTDYAKGAWAYRHGEYDFGSYSRLAQQHVGWEKITSYDELILANDSAYLLKSLEETFGRMEKSNAHWWGLQTTKGLYMTKDSSANLFEKPININKVQNKYLNKYEDDPVYDFLIGSYFLVFRDRVINDSSFQDKINSVRRENHKRNIILNYEVYLTRQLIYKGYKFDTFVQYLYPFHPIYSENLFSLIDEGFPLFKRYLITNNHYKSKNLSNWKKRLKKANETIDIESIEKHLYRVGDASSIYNNLNLSNSNTLLTNEEFIKKDRSTIKNNRIWAITVSNFSHTFTGNEKALFEQVKNDSDITKVILYRSIKPINVEGSNVLLYPLMSREGQEMLIQAKYVFFGHTPRGNIIHPVCSKKHYLVNLWHGIPLKRIGASSLDAHPKMLEQHAKCSIVIASSKIDQLAMAAAFYPLTYNDIKVTGLPRADFLLKGIDQLPKEIISQVEELNGILDKRKKSKLILFAPTFRNKQQDSYYQFLPVEILQLNKILTKYNAILGIREHMADSAGVYNTALIGDNFVNLGNNRFPDIEAIYRVSDILITDYSSSYIDYLLTEKPVISFAYDYENYINSERGMFYDMEDVFPGPICECFSSFIKHLEVTLSDGKNCDDIKYAGVQKMFFDYKDSKNSERLVDLIKNQYE